MIPLWKQSRKNLQHVLLLIKNARTAEKSDTFLVCTKKRLKEVHEIVDSPEYQKEDIYLDSQDHQEIPSHTYSYEEDSGSSDDEPISVFLGSVTSEHSIDNIEKHSNRIYVTVKMTRF